MSYTGDVIPGGPSDVRELAELTIRKISVSTMHNNVYLLTCRISGEQLLIDAADDPARCPMGWPDGEGDVPSWRRSPGVEGDFTGRDRCE